MWLVVSVVVLVVLVATYLTLVATRVDRLHAKAAAAFTALHAHSERRATAAAALGEHEGLAETVTAAKAVLDAAPEDRQAAENALTRALRLATAKLAGALSPAGDDPAPEHAALIEVTDASRRLALARQVHSDLVRDAQAVRRRPVVRMLRLTRRHPEPTFFDIDDPTLDAPD